jgi:hypothetical protein
VLLWHGHPARVGGAAVEAAIDSTVLDSELSRDRMSQTQPVLNYAPPHSVPGTLRLEEQDGVVRVTFPVLSKWFYVLRIVVCALMGLLGILSATTMIFVFRYYQGLIHQPPMPFWKVSGVVVRETIFWWAIAAYFWWRYRRWGRVPRVLIADRQCLTLSHLGLRRMRQRTWTSSEITALQYQPVKYDLNRWRTEGRLSIVYRGGRRRKMLRLVSKDPSLPRHIAERVAAVLQRSL